LSLELLNRVKMFFSTSLAIWFIQCSVTVAEFRDKSQHVLVMSMNAWYKSFTSIFEELCLFEGSRTCL